MKNYQLWGFNFLTTNRDKETNIITGTKEESQYDYYVFCFDGISCFGVNNKFYIAKYPKMRKLNDYYKEKVCNYCGYYPQSGEYGVVMGALGITIECSEQAFVQTLKDYAPSLKVKDIRKLINYNAWTRI